MRQFWLMSCVLLWVMSACATSNRTSLLSEFPSSKAMPTLRIEEVSNVCELVREYANKGSTDIQWYEASCWQANPFPDAVGFEVRLEGTQRLDKETDEQESRSTHVSVYVEIVPNDHTLQIISAELVFACVTDQDSRVVDDDPEVASLSEFLARFPSTRRARVMAGALKNDSAWEFSLQGQTPEGGVEMLVNDELWVIHPDGSVLKSKGLKSEIRKALITEEETKKFDYWSEAIARQLTGWAMNKEKVVCIFGNANRNYFDNRFYRFACTLVDDLYDSSFYSYIR